MNAALALGLFDSVHCGHRSVLNACFALADELGARKTVLTFDDDFFAALNRDCEEIYPVSERRQIILSLGADEVRVLPSTPEFLGMTGAEFLEFLSGFDPVGIACGRDYRFGRNAEGGAEDISRHCAARGIRFALADILKRDGLKVSSTRIRDLLKRGETERANALLGESFFCSGRVESGRGEGHRLGFPTVNLSLPANKIRIKPGVYATETECGGIVRKSVTNLGGRPTFGDFAESLETHMLDFKSDIYGAPIRIRFLSYLRETKKFDSPEALRAQIRSDLKKASEAWHD